jgi:hypothetical protein
MAVKLCVDVNVADTAGGFGQYITGTFTADSSRVEIEQA